MVHVRARLAAVAHDEAFLLARERPQGEAHALASLGKRGGRADQPCVVSHRCSSATESQRARAGRVPRRPASCAPYDTATASTPALAASSRSWRVQPTIT